MGERQSYPLDPFDHDEPCTIEVNGRAVRFHFHPPEDCPDCFNEAVSVPLTDAEQLADPRTPPPGPEAVSEPHRHPLTVLPGDAFPDRDA